MHATLNQLRVTEVNREGVDTLVIDEDLLRRAGIVRLEEIEVVDGVNGQRWTTHVTPATAGSRRVVACGGSALLTAVGHSLRVSAFVLRTQQQLREDGHSARLVMTNANNEVQRVLRQQLSPDDDVIEFSRTVDAKFGLAEPTDSKGS